MRLFVGADDSGGIAQAGSPLCGAAGVAWTVYRGGAKKLKRSEETVKWVGRALASEPPSRLHQ